MEIEFAPRGDTRPTPGVSICCRPGALTGRQNTDNNQMHRTHWTSLPSTRSGGLRFNRRQDEGNRSTMDQATHNKIVSFIWGIADDVLRDLFKRGKYPDVILPMCVLRRMDAVLEPAKQAG